MQYPHYRYYPTPLSLTHTSHWPGFPTSNVTRFRESSTRNFAGMSHSLGDNRCQVVPRKIEFVICITRTNYIHKTILCYQRLMNILVPAFTWPLLTLTFSLLFLPSSSPFITFHSLRDTQEADFWWALIF